MFTRLTHYIRCKIMITPQKNKTNNKVEGSITQCPMINLKYIFFFNKEPKINELKLGSDHETP